MNLDCVSDRDKRKLDDTDISNGAEDGPDEKKSKYNQKKLKGQNKARKHTHKADYSNEACNYLLTSLETGVAQECKRPKCPKIHEISEYMKVRPADIGDNCHVFNTFGYCNRGIACRFAKCHLDQEGNNIKDEEKMKIFDIQKQTSNAASLDLLFALRRKKYNFDLSEKLVQHHDKLKKRNQTNGITNTTESKEETATEQSAGSGVVTDEDVIALLEREKKKICFKDKLYLSPLTTVGNLPFRRICKEFGVDITCGEMAMAKSILQGSTPEWALVKRHHTEDLFGVQICGNNPHMLTKCAQVLDQECNIDFVDLNLGCPIDLVYREGGGCALLHRTRILELCVRNLNKIMKIPLTIKTRTGVYSKENVAHNLVPQFKEWGVSAVTIHGRSREQRYTRSADWQYVQQCAEAAGDMPLFGNGDIMSYEDYKLAKETAPAISGVMIGRGALIKPWIFNEIKEQKVWDISSSERFDLLKKYVNYGLEHWGSDNRGVENTRRFLLEWLSFLYRYVPVGLLECPPQKINDRPPYYKGRDDMETLMASSAATDWIKISEMLLGPVPDNFQFLPKHKANSYK